VKSLTDPQPCAGVARAPVEVQWYVDGRRQPPRAPVVVGVVVGIVVVVAVVVVVGARCGVELGPLIAREDADDEGVVLGA